MVTAVSSSRSQSLVEPADSGHPQDLNLTTPCVHFGTPNLTPGYQGYFAFSQGPDAVVMRMEMIHDARVIPLDGRPHVSAAIRQYQGGSRGRWDGDTLVVDTTNFSPQANFRGSRPWTAMIPLKRTGEEMFE